MSIIDSVSSLFHSGGNPVFVSDSNYALEKFKAEGFVVIPSTNFFSNKNLYTEVVLAFTNPKNCPPSEIFKSSLENSAVLIIPFMSFNGDSMSVDYFLNQLKYIDFEKATSKSNQTLDLLGSVEGILKIISNTKIVELKLGTDLKIFAPKLNCKINYGEWISISQFLEVALIPNENYDCFNLNGTFSCDGVAVAFHTKSYKKTLAKASNAWSLFSKVRKSGGFPLILEIKNSEVLEIKDAFGNSLIDEVKLLTDSELNGYLIEIGFASLEPNAELDWSVNSQLNEAAGGIHLALGMGIEGAHVDFISSFATVS